MSSLTSTATVTRKLIFGLGTLLLGGLIFLVIFNIGKGVYKSIFPDEPSPALIAFGKLPELKFNEGYKPPTNMVYRIETVSGDLDELETRLKVFSIEHPEAKFGDSARTNSWAKSLGFQEEAIGINADVATYADPLDKSRTLQVGITSRKGKISSDYFNKLDLISTQHRGEATAKLEADKIAKVFNLNQNQYPEEKIKYIKYKIDNGKLVESNQLSAVNLIKVNYFREDIDNVPVVYPIINESKVWAITSNNSVVAANIDATMIQEYKFSTYPLKGVQKAFEELKKGETIYNVEFTGSAFDIREVKLGYLDTFEYQPYLQPVYIFESNDGLAAFVRAVEASYIEQEN